MDIERGTSTSIQSLGIPFDSDDVHVCALMVSFPSNLVCNGGALLDPRGECRPAHDDAAVDVASKVSGVTHHFDRRVSRAPAVFAKLGFGSTEC